VCFTGVRLKGPDKLSFEASGAVEASGVSKNTTHLVAMDTSSGSSKLNKAKELNIQIFTLDEFLKILDS
jgi:NAD-dependent DNA ligase